MSKRASILKWMIKPDVTMYGDGDEEDLLQ